MALQTEKPCCCTPARHRLAACFPDSHSAMFMSCRTREAEAICPYWLATTKVLENPFHRGFIHRSTGVTCVAESYVVQPRSSLLSCSAEACTLCSRSVCASSHCEAGTDKSPNVRRPMWPSSSIKLQADTAVQNTGANHEAGHHGKGHKLNIRPLTSSDQETPDLAAHEGAQRTIEGRQGVACTDNQCVDAERGPLTPGESGAGMLADRSQGSLRLWERT